MKYIILLALAAFTLPAQSRADSVTGNQLYSACQGSDPTKSAFCTGYLIGVLEGSKWGSSLAATMVLGEADADLINRSTEVLLGYCHPVGATYAQYIDFAKRYLESNPAKRHFSARTLAHDAWKQAFPCENISFDDLIPKEP